MFIYCPCLCLQCSADFAFLQCSTVFPPCINNTNSSQTSFSNTVYSNQSLCNSVCTRAVGDSGSCPVTIQTTLLAPFIPNFYAIYNCSSPLLYPSLSSSSASASCSTPSSSTPPTPQCQTYSGSYCAGIIDYPVYIPTGLTQQLLESKLNTVAPLFKLATVSTGCRESFMKLLCSTVFTRCSTTVLYENFGAALPLPIPFPRLPCQSLCQETQQNCAAFLRAMPAQVKQAVNCSNAGSLISATYSCSGTQLTSAVSDYPVSTATLAQFKLGTASVPINSKCNQEFLTTTVNVSFSSTMKCPAPLVTPSNPASSNVISGGSCAQPCPSVIFSADDWDSANVLMSVLSVLSFTTCSLMLLTWLFFPIKRRQTTLVYFNFCIWNETIATFIPVLAKGGTVSEVGCLNSSEFVVQQSTGSEASLCLFQSVYLLYFTLTSAASMTVIAIDLYLRVVANQKFGPAQRKKLSAMYGVLIFGLPAISVIIAASTHSFGKSVPVPWCLFSSEASTVVEWGVFYYPVGVLCLIAVYCMCCIVWSMIQTAKKSGRKAIPWEQQARPILFILSFIFFFVAVIAFRSYFYFRTSDFTLSITQWIQCLLTSTNCSSRPTVEPNIHLWWLLQFVVAGQGFINSLIYGTQQQNWQLWKCFLSGNGRFGGEKELILQLEMEERQYQQTQRNLTGSSPHQQTRHSLGSPTSTSKHSLMRTQTGLETRRMSKPMPRFLPRKSQILREEEAQRIMKELELQKQQQHAEVADTFEGDNIIMEENTVEPIDPSEICAVVENEPTIDEPVEPVVEQVTVVSVTPNTSTSSSTHALLSSNYSPTHHSHAHPSIRVHSLPSSRLTNRSPLTNRRLPAGSDRPPTFDDIFPSHPLGLTDNQPNVQHDDLTSMMSLQRPRADTVKQVTIHMTPERLQQRNERRGPES